MKLPELKLKQDVPTRWNSTFYMFERLLQVKEPLLATMWLFLIIHCQQFRKLIGKYWNQFARFLIFLMKLAGK